MFLCFVNSRLLHSKSMCETDWCTLHSLHLASSVSLLFSEKMSINSPLGRYIGVSSYKGGQFFTKSFTSSAFVLLTT